MNTLIIDTSSTAASIAVVENGVILGDFLVNTKKTHSQKLMPMVDSLLKQLDMKIKEMDLLIVCEGPGSFTGVRIGISTVKAFAQPFNTPIQSFSSMLLLACGQKHFEGVVVSVIDAKRNDVYYGIYKWHENRPVVFEEGVLGLNELFVSIDEKFQSESIVFVGDAVGIYNEQFEEFYKQSTQNQYIKANIDAHVPRAVNFSALIGQDDAFKSYGDIKANYMRKSQAERDHNL